jgi:putative flippase GtrA
MPANASVLSLTPVRFILVGIANTFAGLLVIYALKWLFAMPDVPANLLGYAVGLGVSFFLNARWTFSFRGGLASRLPHFLLVTAIGYGANLAVVCAALNLAVNGYLAQAAGVAPYALTTYLGSRLFVFRRS